MAKKKKSQGIVFIISKIVFTISKIILPLI